MFVRFRIITLSIAAITQVRASRTAAPPTTPQRTKLADLSASEVSVLLAWTEAVTAAGPGTDDRDVVLDDARPQAAWRADLEVRPPRGALARELDHLAQMNQASRNAGTATRAE